MRKALCVLVRVMGPLVMPGLQLLSHIGVCVIASGIEKPLRPCGVQAVRVFTYVCVCLWVRLHERLQAVVTVRRSHDCQATAARCDVYDKSVVCVTAQASGKPMDDPCGRNVCRHEQCR